MQRLSRAKVSWSQRARCEQEGGEGTQPPNVDHMPIHTSIHTTFALSARRPQTLYSRADVTLETSRTGGFIEIRPGDRMGRCTASRPRNVFWAKVL